LPCIRPPLVLGLRQRQVRLRLLHLGLVDRRVEPRASRLGHALAFLEADERDATGHFGAHGDRLVGAGCRRVMVFDSCAVVTLTASTAAPPAAPGPPADFPGAGAAVPGAAAAPAGVARCWPNQKPAPAATIKATAAMPPRMLLFMQAKAGKPALDGRCPPRCCAPPGSTANYAPCARGAANGRHHRHQTRLS
jgi:hypothetical protein